MKFLPSGVVAALAGVFALFFSAKAPALLFASTGIVGAQVQVDSLHTQWWEFRSTQAVDIDGGMFTMKSGPRTAASITFEIFPGTFDAWNGVGSVAGTLFTRTLTSDAFTQQYDWVRFAAVAPTRLESAVQYTGVLSSVDAPDRQSEAYFIKGGSEADILLVDEFGNPAGPGLINGSGQVPGGGGNAVVAQVSLPQTSAFVALGGLLLLASRWRSGRLAARVASVRGGTRPVRR